MKFTGILTKLDEKKTKADKRFYSVIFKSKIGESLPMNIFDPDTLDHYINNGVRVFDIDYTEANGFKNLLSITPSKDNLQDYLVRTLTENNSKKLFKEMLVDLQNVVVNPDLKLLLQAFIEDVPTAIAFTQAPAAASVHHELAGGLVLHTYEVFTMVKTELTHNQVLCGNINNLVQTPYPQLSVELALLGAFFHDIGKIWCYSPDRLEIGYVYNRNNMTAYHIALGVEYLTSLLTRKMSFDQIINSPAIQHLFHIIRSHHGPVPEWQSIVEPVTPEAYLVFIADYYSAKLSGFQHAQFNDNGIFVNNYNKFVKF